MFIYINEFTLLTIKNANFRSLEHCKLHVFAYNLVSHEYEYIYQKIYFVQNRFPHHIGYSKPIIPNLVIYKTYIS